MLTITTVVKALAGTEATMREALLAVAEHVG